MKPKKRAEDPKVPVPTYIVTFSDMVTLLLTFFVLLLSLAETQVENHKFERGIFSFRRSIADFGMSGIMMSHLNIPRLDHPTTYFRTDAGQDEPEQRSIDARTEMLRRIIMDIEQMMNISPSHITGTQKTSFQTSITFSGGSWELNADCQQMLKRLTEQFTINFSGQNPTIYVLALAADVPEAQSWAVSARRGQAVAEFIRKELGGDSDWPIFSWGAGPGGEWAGQSGLVTPQTQILIMVLTGGN